MKTFNFFAGPAILPQEVLKNAEKAVANFADMGLSILEISHRSKEFTSVMEEAEALVRELLFIPDEFAVLFLTGGASSQFFMAPMNLLKKNDVAGYCNTGTWSKKAIAEARLYGNIKEVASSEDNSFCNIPKELDLNSDLKYLHITDNNTIYGSEYHDLSNIEIPLVSDMSSNIFSKPIDINKYDLLYAGAQKNLGPAGTTLVIVRKSKIGKTSREIPSMLNYQTHIDKKSSFNTPPVFPIYVSLLSLRWIKKNGGVAEMEKKNIEKANALYGEIDRNSKFYGTVVKEDRSRMNVCFKCKDESLESKFLEFANSRRLIGLKGHRSVGGFRASIYNAMNIEGVEKLVEAMKDFEKENV